MSVADDDSDRSFEATPEKLRRAREKGEVVKSNDLSTFAAYAGFIAVLMGFGQYSATQLGTILMVLIDQSHDLSHLTLSGTAADPIAGILGGVVFSAGGLFILPAVIVLANLLAQRAVVFAPSKLTPKLSRISISSNAKNKYGRAGLFEFSKSFLKLLIYSVSLALFLQSNLQTILLTAAAPPQASVQLMIKLLIQFLLIVVAVALVIGGIDYLWQYSEHLRKNRMSRKELQDEAKDSEGDPHVKQQRRQRAQDIATNQMMADVPKADVVIVNPTHFAVALQWSRAKGTAPVCVAKGVDEVAATIRIKAIESGVPIHSDPPTARALHASTNIGHEISEDYYRPVAAAIRFAEAMQKRAKGTVL
ncbi:MAG: flagellar type III secretion system protein FlhB [Ruegeria sp.]